MNNSIIKTLDTIKRFIDDITDSTELLNKYRQSVTDFTRNRKITLYILVAWLMSQVKKSLHIEIDSFWNNFVKSGNCPTTAAFCKSRAKLKPDFFHDMNIELDKAFYNNCQTARNWHGYRLFSIDGSNLSLPDTDNLRRYYGNFTNNKGEQGPAANISISYDLQNQIISDSVMTPFSGKGNGELTNGLRMMHSNPAGISDRLYLLDRLYGCFATVKIAATDDFKFVCRCKTNLSETVKEFIKKAKTQGYIQLVANYKSKKTLNNLQIDVSIGDRITVRAVKIKTEDGTTVLLLTNLTEEEASAETLAQLYQIRWGVEVAYGIIKNEEQINIFSGIRDCCIRQDFFCAMLLLNIESLITKLDDGAIEAINQCKSKENRPPVQIDRNFTWHVLKDTLPLWLLDNRRDDRILECMATRFLYDLIESNKGKRYPRTKRQRALRGKFYTFTNYKQAI